MIKKIKILVGVLFLSVIGVFTNKASAAGVNVDLSARPLEDYVASALSLAIWVAGLLSVGFIIFGGIQYITAGASKDGAQKAKTTLTYAITGLIIVLLSLVIRNFVLGRLGITEPAGIGGNQ